MSARGHMNLREPIITWNENLKCVHARSDAIEEVNRADEIRTAERLLVPVENHLVSSNAGIIRNQTTEGACEELVRKAIRRPTDVEHAVFPDGLPRIAKVHCPSLPDAGLSDRGEQGEPRAVGL